MRRMVSTACLVALCAFPIAAAQSGTTPPGQQTKTGQEVTVEGCVAADTAMPGQFRLTNAMTASAAADKSTPMTGDKSKGLTYNLMGGTDLKAHVGHKVAVTGMVDSSMSKPMTEKPPTTKPSEQEPGMKDMPAGTLNVKSVKMISTTCP